MRKCLGFVAVACCVAMASLLVGCGPEDGDEGDELLGTSEFGVKAQPACQLSLDAPANFMVDHHVNQGKSYYPSFTWDASPGATGYDILRDGSVLGSSTGLSYTDSKGPNGTYTYSVRAKNSSGCSKNVSTVQASIFQWNGCLKPSCWQ